MHIDILSDGTSYSPSGMGALSLLGTLTQYILALKQEEYQP